MAYDRRMRRFGRIGCAAIVIAVAVFLFIKRGPEPPKPNPPGTWSFAVLGDAPYYAWEEVQYPLVLKELSSNDLAFVIHIGDIWWRPCTDDHYRQALGWFDAMGHPVIYTPGDNETFDCWEPGSGGYAPQERWAALRRIFFSHPTQSLGPTRIPLTTQGGEFVENARWTRDGIVFATVDLIGTRNGMRKFPARTPADDAAARRRTEAAAAWTRDAFAEAARTNARAVVVGFQANMGLENPRDDYRNAFEPFLTTVEQEAARFERPVLLVHGDGHVYIVDHPLRAKNLTRMQVPGSPLVGWVRVTVRNDATNPFAFEEHVMPRWKYF
jgi:hypothetical protein